ncbi:MAG: SMP-30/gluconolactonase/LRE family protein, partial [Ferruginibacter sp.]
MKFYFIAILFIALSSCKSKQVGKNIGEVERIDTSLNAIIATSAKAEVIAEGFVWSEGPLWIEKTQSLLFSDIPQNKIYKWTAEKGKELYLTPSGYTGQNKRSGYLGSNALILDADGALVICQHGNRQIVKMKNPIAHPSADFLNLVSMYNGKKINSP